MQPPLFYTRQEWTDDLSAAVLFTNSITRVCVREKTQTYRSLDNESHRYLICRYDIWVEPYVLQFSLNCSLSSTPALWFGLQERMQIKFLTCEKPVTMHSVQGKREPYWKSGGHTYFEIYCFYLWDIHLMTSNPLALQYIRKYWKRPRQGHSRWNISVKAL